MTDTLNAHPLHQIMPHEFSLITLSDCTRWISDQVALLSVLGPYPEPYETDNNGTLAITPDLPDGQYTVDPQGTVARVEQPERFDPPHREGIARSLDGWARHQGWLSLVEDHPMTVGATTWHMYGIVRGDGTSTGGEIPIGDRFHLLLDRLRLAEPHPLARYRLDLHGQSTIVRIVRTLTTDTYPRRPVGFFTLNTP